MAYEFVVLPVSTTTTLTSGSNPTTVTIKATAGSMNQSAAVTLTVQ